MLQNFTLANYDVTTVQSITVHFVIYFMLLFLFDRDLGLKGKLIFKLEISVGEPSKNFLKCWFFKLPS